MPEQQPTLSIPRDVIEPIITAHVAAAVTAALSDRTVLIDKLVTEVLNAPTDSEGKPGRGYSYDTTFIVWAMRDCVRKATKAALEEAMAKHGDAIKKTMVDQLSKKNSPLAKELAAGMLTGVFSPENIKWRLSVIAGEK